MLNYSIADHARFLANEVPQNFKLVDTSEIEVRTARPKWTWVARACHEIPEGRAILFPVPDGMDIHRFMDNMRCSLAGAEPTLFDKFTIRRSKSNDAVIVMKSGTWSKVYRGMEALPKATA